MIPPQFEYYAPHSVDEAVALLRRFDGEAKVLAGGHSLIPLMKLRLAQPKALVDINRIPNLSYIREEGSHLKIGAMTRTNDLLESAILRKSYPILTDAAQEIADPLVRNLGTVGGNVCHGDPGNDLPACMLALGAEVEAVGPKGPRSIPVSHFYQDTFVTALESTEILVEVRIPKARVHQGNAYHKIEKRAGDFAMAGAAANLVLDASGRVESAGIALTGVGPTALLASAAAGALVGQMPDEAHLTHAAQLASTAAQPSSDLRGPAEYKRSMAGVLARRVLDRALGRAKGGA
jgi:aerobic carbon-monoxide dehydrogenase medium subunit